MCLFARIGSAKGQRCGSKKDSVMVLPRTMTWCKRAMHGAKQMQFQSMWKAHNNMELQSVNNMMHVSVSQTVEIITRPLQPFCVLALRLKHRMMLYVLVLLISIFGTTQQIKLHTSK